MSGTGAVVVRPGGPAADDFVEATLVASWGPTGQVAGHGVLYDPRTLPGYVAELDGVPVGLLTYEDAGFEREIVTVDAVRRGVGVGAALLRAAVEDARRDGLRRLWLITTNDNTVALRAYQRAGFDLVALHRDAVAEARTLKPTLPETGLDLIPMRHELELELRLDA